MSDQKVIETLRLQRNQALDDVAAATAILYSQRELIAELQEEVKRLKNGQED